MDFTEIIYSGIITQQAASEILYKTLTQKKKLGLAHAVSLSY